MLWRALILLLQNASCTCEVNVAKKEAAFVNRDDQLVGNSWEKFRYQEFFEDKTTILLLFFGPLNFNPYLMYHFPSRDLCMHFHFLSSFSLSPLTYQWEEIISIIIKIILKCLRVYWSLELFGAIPKIQGYLVACGWQLNMHFLESSWRKNFTKLVTKRSLESLSTRIALGFESLLYILYYNYLLVEVSFCTIFRFSSLIIHNMVRILFYYLYYFILL